MVKEKNKQFSIKFKPSLMEKVEQHIKLINSTKKNTEPKLTKAAFFNNAIDDYFKDTILTNDFIKLDKPLYFNSKELAEKGSVKCSLNKPTELDEVFIIKRVPNNLDTLHLEDNNSISYYHGSFYKHKGVVFSVIQLPKETKLTAKYLVFDYDGSVPDDVELNISILKPEDLFSYLDIEEDKDLILKLQEIANTFEKDFKKCEDYFSDDENNLKEYDDEMIKGIHKVVLNGVKYIFYNYNCFIPLRMYSKLQHTLILFNNSSFEKISETGDEFISKEDLESYINTFEIEEDNISYIFLFMKIFIDINDNDPKLDNLVNSYVNSKDFSEGIANLFIYAVDI